MGRKQFSILKIETFFQKNNFKKYIDKIACECYHEIGRKFEKIWRL